jgi:hypothetical protein
VALIFEKKVIGKGKTINDALEDAESNLPADVKEVTPILYFVSNPFGFRFSIRLQDFVLIKYLLKLSPISGVESPSNVCIVWSCESQCTGDDPVDDVFVHFVMFLAK